MVESVGTIAPFDLRLTHHHGIDAICRSGRAERIEDLNVGAAGGAILEHGTWTITVSNWVYLDQHKTMMNHKDSWEAINILSHHISDLGKHSLALIYVLVECDKFIVITIGVLIFSATESGKTWENYVGTPLVI